MFSRVGVGKQYLNYFNSLVKLPIFINVLKLGKCSLSLLSSKSISQ